MLKISAAIADSLNQCVRHVKPGGMLESIKLQTDEFTTVVRENRKVQIVSCNQIKYEVLNSR